MLQPHVLEWKKLGCLQTASCQAFRVTLRGRVCAFGFQDECGPSRETPSPPPSAWVSQSPRQCSLGRVGEAGADSQRGRKVALYKFAKKEAGLPCEQKSATEAVQPLLSSSCGLGSGV